MDTKHETTILNLTKDKNVVEIKSFLENLPKTVKGHFFEWYICELYKGNGWISHLSGKKGDEGADILLYHPDSPHKVTHIIQTKNFKRPLTFDETKIELIKFEDKGSLKYNCNQFRVVSINGFVKGSYSLQEWNMDLVDWEHVKHLIDCYRPDQNIVPEIDLYPHNKHTYENITSLFETTKSVAVVQATGTGKSYLIAKIMTDFIDQPKLILAPSNYILDQQLRIVPWMTKVTRMTYSKGMMISDQEIQQIKPNLIILDEFHRCGATEWGKGVERILSTYPESTVIGTSATPIRYLDDNRDMGEELFQGVQTGNLSLVDAISRKILPEPNYISSLYTLDNEIETLTEKVKGTKLEKDEKNDILNDIKQSKIDWEKTSGVPELFRKHLPPEVNKVIVFCRNQKHLDHMEVEVPRWFQKSGIHRFRKIYKTLDEYKDSDKEFDNFKTATDVDTIHLLFAIEKLNEGIHIPDVGAVILLRPTESPIIFYQQIGRCLQVNSDHNPIIFDLVNNFRKIKANNFLNDLNDGIDNIQEKRSKFGLKPYSFDIRIHDETTEIQEILGEIGERLQFWEVGLSYLEQYVEQFGDSRVSRGYKTEEGFNLGIWVHNCMTKSKKGDLTEDRIKILESLSGWTWDLFETNWLEGLEQLKTYVEENGHSRVPQRYKTTSGFNLGVWVHTRRNEKKNGDLTEDRIKILESLPGWTWDPKETNWSEELEQLKTYVEENGHSRVPSTFKTDSGFNLGSWVSVRRKQKKNGDLTEDRIKILESLPGWTWDPFETNWLEGLEQLKTYVEENGHPRVSKGYKTDSGFNLGSWVSNRRNEKKNGDLTEDRIKILESLPGWTWDPFETDWLEGLEQLKTYVEENGHSRVSQGYKTDSGFNLGSWVSVRRKQKKNGDLTEDRIRLLESQPGWTWDILETNWLEGLEHLKTYVEENGHSRVSRGYKTDSGFNLGSWVSNRRKQKKKGDLTEDRIKILESLPGWTWDPFETNWLEGLEQLKTYVEENGHPRVSKGYKTDSGFNLGSWVSNRRNEKKNGDLTEDRIKILESLPGWTWDPFETNWLEGLEHLKTYVEENGHSRVSRGYKTDSGFNLGSWVSNRRKQKKKGDLTEDRIRLLESLPGWTWDPMETKWLEGLEQLKTYVEQEGHSIVIQTYKTKSGFNLGSWVSTRRQQKKNGDLTEDRIKILESLPGWMWVIEKTKSR